jgi:beta-mannosidase
MLSSTSTIIDKGWSFTQLASEKFKDVKPEWEDCKVPTQTHVELKRLGKIPDPYKGLNEWAVQCKLASCHHDNADDIGVGEADWAFKTTFKVSKEQLKDPQADLVFEGLDTFCDISLVCQSTRQKGYQAD